MISDTQSADRLRAACPAIRFCLQAADDGVARAAALGIARLLILAGWTQYDSPEPAPGDDHVRIDFGDDVTGMGRCFSDSAAAARELSRELARHGFNARTAFQAPDLAPDEVRIVVGTRPLTTPG